MGKNSSPNIAVPKKYQDQYLSSDRSLYSQAAQGLVTGDYSFNPSLNDLVSLDPEMTKLAMSYAESSLQPSYQKQKTATANELANLGALESSTTSNAFAQLDSDLLSQYQSIVSSAALEDRTAARSNQMNLFGTGLNTLSSSIGQGMQYESQVDQFNQQNYENQLASYYANKKSSSMGSIGALAGTALGALFALPTGGMSIAAGAALGGALGGTAGSIFSGDTSGATQYAQSGIQGLSNYNTSKLTGGLTTPGGTAGAGNTLLDRLTGSTSRFGGVSTGF
jgi:hypothetical protein